MRAFDVEELPTHGGSLRLFACRAGAAHRQTERLVALRAKERAAGLDRLDAYRGFAPRVEAVKRDFLAFLAAARAEGKRVAAYGAAAKGNTFLNVCGIGADDIVCVFDRSPAKQGLLLPGSHIPILAPERLADVRPDYLRRPAVEPHRRDPRPDRANRRLGRPLGRRAAALRGDRAMKFAPTALPGVARVSLERFADARGFFARLHCPEEFAAAGLPFAPLQTSLSRNDAAFTLRGLHFQAPPHDEAKLVRVVRGGAYDVVVDLRRDSPTYKALDRRDAQRRKRRSAADPGRLRPRLPDARRFDRRALPDRPHARPRPGARLALRRPGDRRRLARRAARHRPRRPRLAGAGGVTLAWAKGLSDIQNVCYPSFSIESDLGPPNDRLRSLAFRRRPTRSRPRP